MLLAQRGGIVNGVTDGPSKDKARSTSLVRFSLGNKKRIRTAFHSFQLILSYLAHNP